MKCCNDAFIVPQAWIEMYTPRILATALPQTSLPDEEKTIYMNLLIRLTMAFSLLMDRVRIEIALHTTSFRIRYNGSQMPRLLIQHRNVEYLAIIAASLDKISGYSTHKTVLLKRIQQVTGVPISYGLQAH